MRKQDPESESVVEFPLLEAIPALPDKSQDPEAWHAIQSILNPSSVEIDENLCCPINFMLLKDPVITADGQTYERKAIEKWFGYGNVTSPLTNENLKHKELITNYFAKNQVAVFLKKNPGLELKNSAGEIRADLVKGLLNACLSGEEKRIRDLVSQDPRLLIHSFESPYKGYTALHFAVAHPVALDTIVELLEKRYRGLALAGLLRKNDQGLLSIHYHIHQVNESKRRRPEDVVTLLKLSMWMGQKISLVSLPPEWPQNLNNHVLNNALAWSVHYGFEEITRFFLRMGANPQAKTVTGETRVYQAVKKGFYDCLLALLEAKADPNLDDTRLNDTPLHYAVKHGATKVAAALIRAGAHLDKELKNGRIPLHVAAQGSSVEILDILLNGQQALPKKLLEAPDSQGNTALHLAAAENKVENAVWLLEHKANPLLFNTQGNTVLHEAAQAGAIEIIKILLNAGVPAELKNEEGLSARQLAEHNGQDAAKEVLFLSEEKPVKVNKNKKSKDLILKQQELIYQQKKEIEELSKKLFSFSPDKTQKFEPVTDKLEELCLSEILVENSLSEKFLQTDVIQRSNFHIICSQIYENNKIALKIPERKSSKWKDIEHEAKMIYYAQQASKKRVVNLKKVFYSGVHYSLCLEYIPSLESLIKDSQKQLSWRTRLSIALEVATALKELHAHKIFHRQIRSHHVLFDEKTKVVKLTDFSHAYFENAPVCLEFITMATMGKGNDSGECWSAPEEWRGDKTVNSAIDIYGFGNLLYELATGSPPFPTLGAAAIRISFKNGKTSEIPEEKCPIGIRKLIQLCWSFDPNKRPNASELIKRLNALISLLPKDTCTVEQEFYALNREFPSQCRFAFCMGLHKRVGQKSSVLTLPQNEHYDKNLLQVIFELSAS